MEQVEPYQPYTREMADEQVNKGGSRLSRELMAASLRDQRLKASSTITQYKQLLRPGFLLNHLDYASFKVVSRTYIHFICLVIISLIIPANNWLGSAPYLLNVLGVWDPPGGFSVACGVYMAFYNVVLTCSSFLFFVVIHAINWRIGGYMTTQEVNAMYPQCRDSDALCLTEHLMDGRLLSIKRTAVTLFGIFFCLAFHHYLCSFKPYYRFGWLAGMVPILIMAPEAAHDPRWDPWEWGKSSVVGFGCSAALKAVLCCVWYPHTSSQKIVGQINSMLDNLQKITTEMFANESKNPTDPDFGSTMSKYSHRIEKTLQKSSNMQFDMDLCKYELAYSRFDWQDLHELANRAKSLGNLLYNYRFAYIELSDRVSKSTSGTHNSHRPTMQRGVTRHASFDYKHGQTVSGPFQDWMKRNLSRNYRKVGQFEQARHDAFLEKEKSMRPLPKSELDGMFHVITIHYGPLREACNDGVRVLQEWFKGANEDRLWSLLSPKYRRSCRDRQQENFRKLRHSMQLISDIYDDISAHPEWISEYLVKDEQKVGTRSFVMSYALHYGFITKEYARHVRNLGKWCLYMDHEQPQAKWIKYQRDESFRKDKFRATEGMGKNLHSDLDTPEDTVSYVPPHRAQARNPDATPPRNLLHFLFLKAFMLSASFWTAHVKYSIKVGAIALIPIVPFFVRTSLSWMHDHRGIWVVLICMISVNASSADCTFGVISRIVASAVGCVIGIACWYMSDHGNSYGLGVILGVVGIFIAFFRHFNTVGGTVMNIVLSLTIVLVTIGSYQETHNPAASLSFVASGAKLALYRFVAVTVGIFVAYICTFLPDFSTSKVVVRQRLGTNLERIGEIHSDLLEYAFQRYDNPHVHREVFKDVIIRKIRTGFHLCRAIDGQLDMLRYEPPLTGIWPKYHYRLFLELEEQILHLMPLFYTLLTRIEARDNIQILLKFMGWTNPLLMSNVSALVFMSSEAIQRARPLPTLTPGHISDFYQSFQSSLFNSEWDERAGYEIELSKTHDGKLILVGMILAEVLYQRLDGLLLIIKSLVGEYGDIDSRVWEGFV